MEFLEGIGRISGGFECKAGKGRKSDYFIDLGANSAGSSRQTM